MTIFNIGLIMQQSLSLIAGNDPNFDIEVALERQVGILPLQFPGMDSIVLYF